MEPVLINIKQFADDRGIFYESYRKDLLKHEYDLDIEFVQDNHSISKKNVIRGLHYQWDLPMHKLVRVSYGKIIDVIVDIRKDSKNFGSIYSYELSSDNNYQLFVPVGFAHGFACLSDIAHVQYKCSSLYNKHGESGINPLDIQLSIDWKIEIKDSIISEKDKYSKSLLEYKLDPKF